MRSRETSRSAVSRTLRGRLTGALAVQLAQRLDGLELLALFLDGVVIAGQTVVVVLGLTLDGQKVPLGLRLGSTGNALVCTELLEDLRGRGLTVADRVLCVIDGGKGLRRALRDVLGAAAVIQGCQLPKARTLLAQVPEARQGYVRARLRRAHRAASADAAASLREGLEEDTLTVLKLGLLPAAPRVHDDQLHREPNRARAPRHPQRHTLARRHDDSALGGPGARASGGALPPDHRPSRPRHAAGGAAPGRGVSGRPMVSHPGRVS